MSERAILRLNNPAFEREVQKRRAARMAYVDLMPPEWRALVHEYGLNIVKSLRDCGVQKPNHAKHIITTIIGELSPMGPIGGRNFSNQGESSKDKLVMVPAEPSEAMIQASMETIAGFDVSCSKHEKHRRRLRAAIGAANRLRPTPSHKDGR